MEALAAAEGRGERPQPVFLRPTDEEDLEHFVARADRAIAWRLSVRRADGLDS